MSNGRDEPQSTVPDGKAGREPGCAANELFKAVLWRLPNGSARPTTGPARQSHLPCARR